MRYRKLSKNLKQGEAVKQHNLAFLQNPEPPFSFPPSLVFLISFENEKNDFSCDVQSLRIDVNIMGLVQ
ncbi:hypothetical protein Syun_006018 [Stephania yunnanensis]|uniref:Uncharacterized protein n=1 Tax=Stephania yunnanensis TaxID=152371 RepID=A0AAP0KXI6_9MAGN